MSTLRAIALALTVLAVAVGFGTGAPVDATLLPQVVTKTADTADGVCDADCSLREAITVANLNPSLDVINFNIPATDPNCSGTGVCTISPTANFSSVSDPVVIDGLTQPGASSGNLKIELNGDIIPAGTGLHLLANGGTVRGLIINRFAEGIRVEGTTAIHGSYIGTDATGAVDLGNQTGIRITAGTGSTVGGLLPGDGNVIAFNDSVGVQVDSPGSNRIQRNSIHSNGQRGIVLGQTCAPINDLGDSDSGPNGCQNFPVITGAFPNAGGTIVEGALNSTPNTVFELDFYSSDNCNASNHGEGQTFVGAGNELSDVNGDLSFSYSFAASVPSGAAITATATDQGGNTSEFSHCYADPGKGDVDCSNTINAVDSLKLLRFSAALSVGQSEPCPDVGVQINALPEEMGDINCTDEENSVDALFILRHNAGLSVNLAQGCRAIGTIHGTVITATDFAWTPATFSAAKDRLVGFSVRNDGAAPHALRIDGGDGTFPSDDDTLAFPTTTSAGLKSAVTWQTPNVTGPIQFRCDLHPAMLGTINLK